MRSALSSIIFRAIVEKEAIAPAMLVNRSVRTMLPLLGQTVLVSVLVMVGMLLFIIPGIYFAIALSLAPIALVLGDNSVIGSMNNSMKAVRGSWWTTLAFGLVLGLLIGLIFIILLIPSLRSHCSWRGIGSRSGSECGNNGPRISLKHMVCGSYASHLFCSVLRIRILLSQPDGKKGGRSDRQGSE
jgi:hypothetical protein